VFEAFMKLSIPGAFVLAVLTGAASAGEANNVRETTTAEADAFAARIYGVPPGDSSYACFVRRYDAEHRARHPKQGVAAMKLLISAETDKESKQLQHSFRLGFRYRHRSGDFDSSGSCGSHAVLLTDGSEVRLGCGVDCEGGGIEVALSKDNKSAIVRLEQIRVWQNNKPDEEAEQSLVAGADDKVFRLDRTDKADCASLVTDRKELAALRRK
jgi:hypothetical protein